MRFNSFEMEAIYKKKYSNSIHNIRNRKPHVILSANHHMNVLVRLEFMFANKEKLHDSTYNFQVDYTKCLFLYH